MSAARFTFSQSPLDGAALRERLTDVRCGGFCAFEGWVRDHNEGRAVRRLEYEAFEALAVTEGERIIAEACERFGVTRALCVHRVGDLDLGEMAVWVGVSAGHRDEAFKAARYIIDEVKHRVPIWKKEHYVDGDSGWVNCERCAVHAHDHSHDHDHDHDHHHAQAQSPATVSPSVDYSRQRALAQVGEPGQAKLRASRVAVIGAGGLGVPVMQYLAGAGIGHLTVIDGDALQASNLHRQTWYALSECGQPKAQLAEARIRALNPEVSIKSHLERLSAQNIDTLLVEHDVLIDCSDNFRCKFLLNDWAQTHGVPLVTASVHQFEGQLQVIDPRRRSSCLRCQWPRATEDGVVGTCAEAGVLGPTPGVLGSLQALEALKLILDMPGSLGDEVLLVDLLHLGTQRLRSRRRSGCQDRCALSMEGLEAAKEAAQATSAMTDNAADLELFFDDLRIAEQQGLQLIDIRDHKEIGQAPLPLASIPHRPMLELLSGDNLPQAGRYLLICSRGQRSLTAARRLRERGLEAYSLKGGAVRWQS
ncbi:MAG: molybdopterin converting factor [Gammaproteobacteria bacterium]|nr:molybdopterin converting factor [Gammaproteobacteria bacterium]